MRLRQRQGGKIVIGIDDDMSVVGVNHLHQLLEDIPNKIVTMLGIVPSVTHIERDGKDIIEIEIEHSNIPISYKGVFYVRSGATNQELRGVALQQSDQKTDQKTQIIELMKKNPSISRSEIAAKTGLHDSTIKRRIESLLNEGRIRRVGPDKGGHWEVTEK